MNDKKMENVIHIFPLTLYQNMIGLTENEREILIQEIYNQEKQGKNPDYRIRNKNNAWTGDTQGFEYLFSNKKFKKLFSLISLHIKEYAKIIGLNTDKIDFYYQRAWATISRKGEYISKHEHCQSHITFAYYLKKNQQDGGIRFHNLAAQNEISRGSFDSQTLVDKDFIELNYSNSPAMNFLPKTDQIIIFPSKTLHSTLPSSNDDERISISADVSIITKNSENLENLLTPIDKWEKF